jgi:hypothetical protein
MWSRVYRAESSYNCESADFTDCTDSRTIRPNTFGVRRQSEASTALWIASTQHNPKRCRASLATALQILLTASLDVVDPQGPEIANVESAVSDDWIRKRHFGKRS